MKKIIVSAVIIGIIITLITGIINTTPADLVGASWYGWPFAWRIIPVVPNPEASYDIAKFIGDWIVWSIVAFVVMFILSKLKK